MTRTDLFVAFGNVNEEYRSAAIKSMQTKPLPSYRPRLRYALIAATLVLLVALTPIIILLANRTTPPPNPPQPSTHLSITDIPGAVVYNGTDYLGTSDFTDVVTYDQLIDNLSQGSSAIGTAKHVSTVTIPSNTNPSNDIFYSITTFDLTVITPINQLNEGQTVRIISFCVCFEDGTSASLCAINSHALSAIKQPTAFYHLTKLENSSKYVNGKLYDLSPYADYYLSGHFETDGQKIQYLGKNIYFSQIQNTTS